jgi:uncharacterized UPF0146 family protein
MYKLSSMLDDEEDILRYIKTNYPGKAKIVEIGVGREDNVYRGLKKTGSYKVSATDLIHDEGITYDDALDPNLNIYYGVDLIYSIRPPPELISGLQNIAREVGADLLIRPLSTDSCHKPESMKLVNFGKAVLWVGKR